MKAKKRFLGGMFFTVLATVSFAHTALVYADEPVVNAGKIQEFNQQNKAHGATWVAKETWVSKLSQKDLKRMLGNNDMPKNTLDYHSDPSKAATVPATFDWRNNNGVNWLGEVLNQGNCGSCVAYSTVATLEAQVSISAGLPWLHPGFSPEQLFMCGGASCDSGWMPGPAATFLKNKGIVDAACSPDTTASTGTDVSCAAATAGCSDAASRTYKISGVTNPSGGGILGGIFSTGMSSGSVDKVKEALTHGPVVTTLTVYTDFLTYSGGIYKSVSGKAEGGHAVSIVGYNATDRYWIVRNSWGKDWGENGFIRVSWDDRSGVGSSTWQFQLPTQSEYLTIASPAENDYVSGQVQAKVGTSSTSNLNVEVRKAGTTRAISTLSCASSGSNGCVSALDTSALADGRYEMIAKSGNTGGFSQVRSFYIANQVPQTYTLSAAGKDVDLTKPVKDRIEFNITAKTSTVPFHTITMFVRQNGQIKFQRTTPLVLGVTTIGIHTDALPNGNYELFFRGELPAGGQTLTADSNVFNLQFKN